MATYSCIYISNRLEVLRPSKLSNPLSAFVHSHHYLSLLVLLVFAHDLQQLAQVPLKGREDEGAVLSSTHLLVCPVETLRNASIRKHTRPSFVVVVHDQEASRIWKTGVLEEKALKLCELFFASGCCRIHYKQNSVCFLLDGSPALLVLHVPRNVPKFNWKTAVVAGWLRCISFKFNYSAKKAQFSLVKYWKRILKEKEGKWSDLGCFWRVDGKRGEGRVLTCIQLLVYSFVWGLPEFPRECWWLWFYRKLRVPQLKSLLCSLNSNFLL